MKLTLSASALSALCLLESPKVSVEAFTNHASRFVKKPPPITASTKQLLQPTGSPSTRSPEDSSTALHVSSLQDRLKEIGENMDIDDSNPFMQQLKKPVSLSERELGLLVLFTVPVAWGTYASTVQSIYTLDPQIPGFLFSTCYFFVAAAGSLAATAWNTAQKSEGDPAKEEPKSVPAIAGLELGFYVYMANFLHVIGLQTVPSDRAGFLFQLTTVMVPMLEALFARDLLAISGSTWVACALALAGIFVMGMEWPFGGEGAVPNALAALEGVDPMSAYVEDMTDFPSSSAVDATTASVTAVDPSVVQAASDSGQAVVDNAQVVADSAGFLPDPSSILDVLVSGDSLITCAALLYALQIIRISKWTTEYSALQIMTGKTVAESLLSFLFLGGTVGLASSGIDVSGAGGVLEFLQNSGHQAMDFFQTASQRFAEGSISAYSVEHFAGACLWTGLITTCYLVFAQSYGQQYAKASDANLIYSLQPLFTAFFAYLMLGETLQPMGYVGGAFIFSGVYLVGSKSISGEQEA